MASVAAALIPAAKGEQRPTRGPGTEEMEPGGVGGGLLAWPCPQWHLSLPVFPGLYLLLTGPFPRSPLVLGPTLVSFCPPQPLLASLLTCFPARHPASTPWWTAPSAPRGLRSLAGPSAGDSHTTAAGGVGLPGPVLRQVTLCSPQEWCSAQVGQRRQGGNGGRQVALRALGPHRKRLWGGLLPSLSRHWW